jgi:hypothetical protein
LPAASQSPTLHVFTVSNAVPVELHFSRVSPEQRCSPLRQNAVHTPLLQTGVLPLHAVSVFHLPEESQARGVEPTHSAEPGAHSLHSFSTASHSPAPQALTESNPVRELLHCSRMSPLHRCSPVAHVAATQSPSLQTGVVPLQAGSEIHFPLESQTRGIAPTQPFAAAVHSRQTFRVASQKPAPQVASPS